jgi:tetratricopeptide (TPR) repeat protein
MLSRLVVLATGWLVAGIMFLPGSVRALDCGQNAYDCALYYVSRKDFPQAISYLNETLNRFPTDLKARNLLGIALTGSGEIDKANREFKKALELNPRFYPALKNLATNELTLKRTADARVHFEQVLKLAPGDEVAHIMLAEIFFAANQCQTALGHYDKSYARIVSNPEWIFHYSHCSIQQGRQQQAIAMLALLPADDATLQFQAGMELGRAKAYIAAASHFDLARKGYPDPYQAGYNQVLMQIKGGDLQGGILTANKLLSQGYQRAELYNLLSEANVKAGNLQDALHALRQAVEINPTDEENYLDLAALCESYRNYDLGIQIADIGIQNIPGSFRLYLQRGIIRAGKADYTDAEKDFVAAQTLAPRESLPSVVLAMTWMIMGQFPKAVGLLREKAKLTPNDYLTQYTLGVALVRSGPAPGTQGEQEAISAFESSIGLNPGFANAHSQLGKVLLRRGEVDRAIAELEKAVTLDPTEVGATYQMAQAYHRNGNEVRSAEWMARFTKLQAQEREDEDAKLLKGIVSQSSTKLSKSPQN